MLPAPRTNTAQAKAAHRPMMHMVRTRPIRSETLPQTSLPTPLNTATMPTVIPAVRAAAVLGMVAAKGATWLMATSPTEAPRK